MISYNTILILFGLVVNAGVIVGYLVKLERRFTKIETFLKIKHGFDDHD